MKKSELKEIIKSQFLAEAEDSKKGNSEEQKRMEGAIRDDRDHIKNLEKDIKDNEEKLAKLKKDYKKELEKLQGRLNLLSRHPKFKQHSVVAVFKTYPFCESLAQLMIELNS